MSLRTARRSHWFVVLACLVAVSLATAAAVHNEGASASASSPAARASHSGSPVPRATAAHVLNFGLAYGDTLLGESDARLSASLNDAVSLGVGWIRLDLPWDAVQTQGPAQFDWSGFDRVVTAADVRGLKIDAVLDAPPYWARQYSCRSLESCPPAENSEFAAFAAAAATRYAPLGVHTWEIWNEPNFGWAPKPDAAAYEKLLAAVSQSLRRADPRAFVILGGLAAITTNAKLTRVSAFDFLTEVAKLGGTRYVNAVGYHPYSLPTMPSAATEFQTIANARNNLVAVLQQYRTPKVSVWLTESGAQVAEQTPNLKPAQVDKAAAEQTQAEYATDLVKTVEANDNVGADFWYADQDAPSSALYFGLHDADGTARPAFSALKSALTACSCNLAEN